MPLLDVHEVAIPETRDVISDARDLEELRVQWLELWRRCPHATPFQSPDWLLPWWRNLGAGAAQIPFFGRARAQGLIRDPLYETDPSGPRFQQGDKSC